MPIHAETGRDDPVWIQAEPHLRARKTDVHVPLSLAWCERLRAAYPNADRDICLLAILLHDIGWSAIDMDDILTEGFRSDNAMQSDLRYRHEAKGVRLAVTAPTTGALIDHGPDGGPQDADRTITGAARTFETWRRRPLVEGVRPVKACANTMPADADTVGAAFHSELGRPLPACITETTRSANLLDICAKEGLRRTVTKALAPAAGEKAIVARDPLSLVMAITPFNCPITLLIFKRGAALVAGFTVVAKPAEETPLSTLKLAGIFHAAGLPEGAFDVVTGGRSIGQHRVPRQIAFIGGTAAGKAITAAGTLKRLTLELGGRGAAIIRADADLDKAANAIACHGFANSGQFGHRVNRIYVERPAYEAFLDALLRRVAAHTMAPVGDSGDLGPMINARILPNAAAQVADAGDKGARILLNGEQLYDDRYDGGCYLPPTLIADATPDMAILREQTFGPVLGICPVDNPRDALRQANMSRYGLAGFVLSADLARGLTLCEGVEAGSVWLNFSQHSSHHATFGGVKESGIGREEGRYGVESFPEYKPMYLSHAVPA